jgi:DNA-binding Lrp family transcriptional regulator
MDFILVVTAASMEEYGRFTRESFESNAGVARYETFVTLDRVKVGLALPVQPETPPPKSAKRRKPR